MAHYSASVTSPWSPDRIYAYLADFRTVAEWDPSITESVQIGDGEAIKVGSQYRVITKTSVSEVVLEYTTTELDRPTKIALRGENSSMVSVDTITIARGASGGSNVTYDAEIELKGMRRLADPVLELGFKRIGDKARNGLERKLNEP